jgi:2-(1,2-epoxy-1,2-dihydrophenyl)acetyl-CoA isomerase
MSYEHLIYEVEDSVARITLNRPERMNAMSTDLRDEIRVAVESAGADAGVKVIVISGMGDRAFSAGADVKDMGEGGAPPSSQVREEVRNGWNKMVLALLETPKPVIAMVNGVAAGGGFGLALACDIRIASENARFGQVFVNIGLVPDCGSTFFLPRLVGTGRALDMIYSGRVIDAAEADRIGLVNMVVPAADLEKVTMDYARQLASKPPLAHAGAKDLVYKGLVSDLRTALDAEADLQALMFSTEDHHEGVSAFLEKRQGSFQGR